MDATSLQAPSSGIGRGDGICNGTLASAPRPRAARCFVFALGQLRGTVGALLSPKIYRDFFGMPMNTNLAGFPFGKLLTEQRDLTLFLLPGRRGTGFQ